MKKKPSYAINPHQGVIARINATLPPSPRRNLLEVTLLLLLLVHRFPSFKTQLAHLHSKPLVRPSQEAADDLTQVVNAMVPAVVQDLPEGRNVLFVCHKTIGFKLVHKYKPSLLHIRPTLAHRQPQLL